MQAPVASRAPTSGPERRNTPAKYRDYQCFRPDGEVWCFCNTEPRIKAIRRVTRKESSPNLGREFWSCGNWVEGEACGFFLWCDQAKRMGRDFTTPPPPEPKNYVQPTDAQRRRPSPVAYSVPLAPAPPSPTSSPTKRPISERDLAVQEAVQGLDDIDFDEPIEGFDPDDDIVDDAESPATARSASPSKKARFESFAGPPSPQTPSRRAAAAGAIGTEPAQASGFAAIQADPDSPFHAIQKNLFAAPSSTIPVVTSGSSILSSPAKASNGTSQPDAFAALLNALSPVASLLDSAKKERDKEARLLLAAKRKEETLRKTYEKERDERERLQKENEALKNRIRLLEHELVELRIRKS
ncbi:hypothetical protein BMF94_2845 [Rhodotorula taiwanensis]|uniref:GRF-type domain-containing protein n=1 Tax=Rhodotorula taiwanensis TaxID=741276 RepID=A0A2S5BB97_9BASI|nr:hypothetical protein BMF94_2845 [Rhodotorula taiwanensis]